LHGTVLSLWDAVELEASEQGSGVAPMFINLTDASIKMVSQVHAQHHFLRESATDSWGEYLDG